jgi:hypothetical protein
MSTRLGSTVESVWRAARGAVVRLNHLLAETGNSDDDLVFHIRRAQSGLEANDVVPDQIRAAHAKNARTGEL